MSTFTNFFGAQMIITLALSLAGLTASAMTIAVTNPNPQAQQAGIQLIQLNGAHCDNDVRPESCDLFFYSSKGRIVRLQVDFNARTYTYVSASNRTFRANRVSPDDMDILERLAIGLERLGIDCPSAVIIQERTKEIVQVVPGCDI